MYIRQGGCFYKQIGSIQKPPDYQAMVLQPSITNYTPLFLVSIYARAGWRDGERKVGTNEREREREREKDKKYKQTLSATFFQDL